MNRIGVLGLALMAAGIPFGEPAWAADLTMGPSRIAQLLAGKDSLVVTVDVALQDTASVWADRMWGTEQGIRITRHIDTISIRWAKSDVDVPLSAYADLGQPQAVEFVKHSKGPGFIIRGGETATGYTAEFFLERGVLVRRRVSLGEFEHDVWEETRYSGPNKGVD